MATRLADVEGVQDLSRQLLEKVAAVKRPEAFRVMLIAGRVLRDAARAAAPVGPTRSLRKSIQANPAPRRGNREPAAFTLVNLFKDRGVKAPHGHLVSFGTKERTPKRKAFMKFEAYSGGGDGPVFARRVGRMKPNPFFQRAVEGAAGRALTLATAELERLITKS